MATFGTVLRDILESKKVNKLLLSEKLGINRSLFYRYLADKTVIPRDILDKIEMELMLIPAEIDRLEEKYAEAQIGAEIYRARKLLDGLIHYHESRKDGNAVKYFPFYHEYVSGLQEKMVLLIKSHDEIQMAFRYILSDSDDDDAYLFCQPENKMIMEETTLFLNSDTRRKLYHVFKLARAETPDLKIPLDLNLEIESYVLHNLFPLEKYCRMYFAAYYYDSLFTPKIYMFHNRLLTRRHAMFFTENESIAMLHNDPEICNLFYEDMRNTIDSVEPLLKRSDYIKEYLPYQYAMMAASPESAVSFEPHPIFSRVGLISTLRKSLWPHSDKQLDTLICKSKEALQKGCVFYNFFHLDGLDHFINTGVLSDLYAMQPLSKEQIRDYLQTTVDYALKYGNVSLQIIKEDAPEFLRFYNYHIYKDYAIVLCDLKSPDYKTYTITEKSLVCAVSDYFFNVIPHGSYLESKEKTIQILQDRIAGLSEP